VSKHKHEQTRHILIRIAAAAGGGGGDGGGGGKMMDDGGKMQYAQSAVLFKKVTVGPITTCLVPSM